ncbi:hypothetical protein CLAIMM_14337 [Cladophialophora immunda]|nr:hypothetical protein CLAIMM_14337 [Cladophialophora immunda]
MTLANALVTSTHQEREPLTIPSTKPMRSAAASCMGRLPQGTVQPSQHTPTRDCSRLNWHSGEEPPQRDVLEEAGPVWNEQRARGRKWCLGPKAQQWSKCTSPKVAKPPNFGNQTHSRAGQRGRCRGRRALNRHSWDFELWALAGKKGTPGNSTWGTLGHQALPELETFSHSTGVPRI